MNLIKSTAAELLSSVSKVTGIIGKSSPLPIIQNLFIAASNGSHRFIGSDVEIQVTASASLGGEGGMETTVQAARFVGLLKSFFADQVVTLSSDAGKLTLKAGRSRFTLQTMPAQDFPMFLETPDTEAFEVPERALAMLIDQVSYAMADGDVRQFLNGMFVEVKNEKLFAVASTGHRLAISHSPLLGVKDQSAIIPRKAVLELRKLLGSSDDPVSIRLSLNHARFDFKGVQFLTRLVSGKYVPYERAIPAGLPNEAMVNRQVLLSALRRSALVLDEKVKAVRFKFAEGLLTIDSRSGAEEGSQEIEIAYAGPEVTIGMPVAQVADGLSNFAHDMVRLQFDGADKAMLLTYGELPDWKYVVSPMRI